MPWLLTSPGHQQPWYWLCRICKSWSYLRKDFKYLCHINVEKWHKMQIYVYVPSENLACRGLNVLPSKGWSSCSDLTWCPMLEIGISLFYRLYTITPITQWQIQSVNDKWVGTQWTLAPGTFQSSLCIHNLTMTAAEVFWNFIIIHKNPVYICTCHV